nr:hypothetical protein [Candidatus Sigynarchaeota archaeon]
MKIREMLNLEGAVFGSPPWFCKVVFCVPAGGLFMMAGPGCPSCVVILLAGILVMDVLVGVVIPG